MDFAKITIFHVNTEGACDNVKVTRELPGLLAKNPPGHSTCNHVMDTSHLITARNEVGARLCFYTCVWFCSQGGAIPACIAGGIPTCLAAGLQGGCYRSMHCRWYPNMPCSRSPGGCLVPGGACLGEYLVPGGCPPGTATAAGGTHPTGMHSSCII